ncbi:hypothetical protein PRK78_001147 [Emydomyces testavorans]|uniref:Uncharacterized protein n=1 Tax=Emydomyces testavorans TaxID=2070801 RepID=A0AAF0DCT4_9EURO|nr:hypothetical protein PRK78_001147 [Emydomyces testavorans]
METATPPSEGNYASSSGLQHHPSQNHSEFSSSFQPVTGQGLGLTPLPGTQLPQDRNHHDDLDIDLRGVGEFGSLFDLPADLHLDLNEIDRFIRDADVSGWLDLPDQPGQVSSCGALAAQCTESRDSSARPQRPYRASANIPSEPSNTRYRPIAPKLNPKLERKRSIDDIGFDDDENELLSVQGNGPAAKRQCVNRSISPKFSSDGNSISNQPQLRRSASATRQPTDQHLSGYQSDNLPEFSTTSSVDQQNCFNQFQLASPCLTIKSCDGPGNAINSSLEGTRSTFVSLALPEKPSDIANIKPRASEGAVSLPPFSSPGSAFVTPQPSTNLDTGSYQRESSIDSLFDDRDGTPVFDANSVSQPAEKPQYIIPFITNTTGTPISDHLKKVCQIQDKDLLLTQSREAAWFFRQQPNYISPYPQPGGNLGYLPSAPSLHVRSIKASEKEVAIRLSDYRRRLRACMCDRDKYMEELRAHNHVDPVTRKSEYQKLKDEAKYLKRTITRQRKKEEETKKEADYWQKQYTDVASTYNNLCAQFHHLRQLASVLQVRLQRVEQARSFTSPSPMGQGTRPHDLCQPDNSIASTAQTSITTPHQSPPTSGPMTPSVSTQAAPITIDLTSDNNVESSTNQPKQAQNTDSTAPPESQAAQKKLVSAMRQKGYQWLGNKNHMHQCFTHSLSTPPQLQSHGLPGHTIPCATASQKNDRPRRTTKNDVVTGQVSKAAADSQKENQAPSATTGSNAEKTDSNEVARVSGADPEGLGHVNPLGAKTNAHRPTGATFPPAVTEEEVEDEFVRMLERDLEASL